MMVSKWKMVLLILSKKLSLPHSLG
jgi:hypothetical protein